MFACVARPRLHFNWALTTSKFNKSRSRTRALPLADHGCGLKKRGVMEMLPLKLGHSSDCRVEYVRWNTIICAILAKISGDDVVVYQFWGIAENEIITASSEIVETNHVA